MGNDSEALGRIEEDFTAFCESIKICREAQIFKAADWKNAYAASSRVRDRYLKEKRKSALKLSELEALSKVFEHDVFTGGMMNIRQVGEHTQKREKFEIRTIYNIPIEFDISVSARPMFCAPIVVLEDIEGKSHRINHLEQLEEMENRIRKAIQRAKS